MQIYGSTYLHGPQAISAPHTPRAAALQSPQSSASTGDAVEISSAGNIMEMLSRVPDIRQDQVNALRAAISSGSYETSDKISSALDNLLNEIG